ncbi:MAG: hypothetical protein EOO15_05215 [Chitinophagaceae bacterium]|nr:MAG: hypothetical protein EOO15_05215 [Chitinophagaceae bacterium]
MPIEETYYASGALRTRRKLEGDRPANGISVEEFYENGQPARCESWSHGLLIEYKTFAEDGTQTAHKIYNHRLKELVDRPLVTKTERPNVVVGFGHMGFYFEHLPAIAAFIGGDYNEDDLYAAYQRWMNREPPERNPDEDWEAQVERWYLPGTRMNFALWFEEGEMLYQWQVWARDEESYWEARAFMEALPR